MLGAVLCCKRGVAVTGMRGRGWLVGLWSAVLFLSFSLSNRALCLLFGCCHFFCPLFTCANWEGGAASSSSQQYFPCSCLGTWVHL